MKHKFLTVGLITGLFFAPVWTFAQQNQSPNLKDTSIQNKSTTAPSRDTRNASEKNFNNAQGTSGQATPDSQASVNPSGSGKMNTPDQTTQDGNYSGTYNQSQTTSNDQSILNRDSVSGVGQAGQGRNWSWLGLLGLLGLLGMVGKPKTSKNSTEYRGTTTMNPKVSPS